MTCTRCIYKIVLATAGFVTLFIYIHVMYLVCGFLFFGLLVQSQALYTSSDDVIELTQETFFKATNDDDLWFVEFYAPWCGHCQSLAPEWKKAATALKGVVKIAAVDMDKYGEVGRPYNVRGFPTIKIFGQNKNSPEDYNGGRDASSIVNQALQHLSSLVRGRLSGGGGRSSGGGGGSSSGGGGGGSGDEVVELTDSNFDKLVMESEDMWLVEFFAPWCGHCKTLKPHWDTAASELKGKVKLGALDATVHTMIAARFGVQGYPTIKHFPAGKKAQSDVVDFDGGRTSEDIVRWALDKAADSIPPPDIVEVTDQAAVDAACKDHQLCVISVLPNILDCQAKCRNDYLTILREMGAKFKKNQWGWIWSEATAQMEMEEALGIGGFGYPAMAAMNTRKMKYAILRGPFSEVGINEFLRALALGRGSTFPVKGDTMPAIKTTPAWDGKDGTPPVDEEIDLSELGIDTSKTEL